MSNREYYDFDEEYDRRVSEEMEERRKRRREVTKHRNAIARCNRLLLGEAFALFVLVLALIFL